MPMASRAEWALSSRQVVGHLSLAGFPALFGLPSPLLTQLPSAAAQAARREHSNSHDSLQWAQLTRTARHLPQRDTHAGQGMCSSCPVSVLTGSGLRGLSLSLFAGQEKERQPGNGLRSITGLGLVLGEHNRSGLCATRLPWPGPWPAGRCAGSPRIARFPPPPTAGRVRTMVVLLLWISLLTSTSR